MGRFQATTERIRRLEWGEVEFTDSHSLKLRNGNFITVFHRWGAPRGSYPQWKAFREQLKRRKSLTQIEVFELATKYEVPHLTRWEDRRKEQVDGEKGED